jgi:hypothetical protein
MENGGIVPEGRGGGTLVAEVVDPLAVTGHTYRVEFFESSVVQPGEVGLAPTSYSVVDATTGELKLDGAAAEQALGRTTPLSEHVVQFDGLSLSLHAPPAGPFDIDGSEAWAFVQVQGGDGLDADACLEGAASSFGCAEVGGNWVYGSFNGRGDWIMYHFGAGPEESGRIGAYAPNDFEIRVTEAGSYGYYGFSSGNTIWTPFEVWDIGPTGTGSGRVAAVNDPSDDVQMIPVLFADGGGECFFGFGEADDPFGLGWPATDRIYGFYPVDGSDYAAWHSAAQALVDAHPDGCPTSPETDDASLLIDFSNRPIQRIVFMMDPTSPEYRDEMIPVGNVVRFHTTKPNLPGDVFTVNTAGFEVKRQDVASAEEALDALAIVPNPYKGASDYELTNLADVVRFTNMPQNATIRVFTLSGTLIKTINKSGPSTSLDWDLTSDEDLPIASGMYLVHIEVPNLGEKVIKFGVVKKRIQLDLL